MLAVTAVVCVLSVVHITLGLISICVGVAASIQAELWLAHSVSPIWSGGFFTVTGILGFACAKRKSAYLIMCFTAFSMVSLVTAIVSMQLLRHGLVNQMTDGAVYAKKHKDKLILTALAVAGTECLFCVVSALVSCRLAKVAKNELSQKREGTFYVQDAASPETSATDIRWNQITDDQTDYVDEPQPGTNVFTIDIGDVEDTGRDVTRQQTSAEEDELKELSTIA